MNGREIVDEAFRKKRKSKANPEIRKLELPAAVMEYLRKIDTGFFFHMSKVDGERLTVFTGKIPLEEDIKSLCKIERLPMILTAQALKTPFGRIARLLLKMYDKPKQPYIGEMWINVLDETQVGDIEYLKIKLKTMVMLYDRNNVRRCIKEFSLGPETGRLINIVIDTTLEEPTREFDMAKIWAITRFPVE